MSNKSYNDLGRMGKDGRRGEIETGGDSKNPGSNSISCHRLFKHRFCISL